MAIRGPDGRFIKGSGGASGGGGTTGLDVPLPEMNAMLARVGGRAPAIRTRTHTLAAEALIAEAMQDQVVPRDEGHLRDSQRPGVVDDRGGEIVADIEYALVVHETHETKPRWLTNTIARHGPRVMRAAVERALREEIGR